MNCHIDYVSRKISTMLVFLYRVGKFLTESSKMLIYNGVSSYCCSLLYGVTDTGIGRINMLQNTSLQIILCRNKICNVQL